jgi:hypothetical protein
MGAGITNESTPSRRARPFQQEYNMFTKDDLLFAYSRADALADGVLVDVTTTAREAGIVYPVALTRAVWCRCVEVPEGVEGQDEAGRLWDVLWMLRDAIGKAKPGTQLILYQLHVRNDSRRARPVTLKAVCGPADDGSPCITVLLPEED